MTTNNTDQEKKCECKPIPYIDECMYCLHREINKQELEIQSLKELLCEAEPWVIEAKYANALNKKPYNDRVEWQKKYEEVMR